MAQSSANGSRGRSTEGSKQRFPLKRLARIAELGGEGRMDPREKKGAPRWRSALPERYLLPDLDFVSRSRNNASVPITWPFRVPGISGSHSVWPFLPSAIVTLFTCRVL